ncbi:MAG: glutathione S-transferase family protein [Gammaproteobacteria bacterium]
MIKLFGFGPQFGVPDPSPFVLKVDAFMRMAGIEFAFEPGFDNLRKAPKGKLPFIEDDGKVIADSFFIIEHLRQKYHPSLDEWLSEEQRAIADLIIKSLDENFYWCLVYSRWFCDDTWPTIKTAFFGGLPFPANHVVPIIVRRGICNALIKQGMGRHNDQEILSIAQHTLASLSRLLDGKPYFLGGQPCTLDAAAFAFLAQLILVDYDNPTNRLAASYGNLVDYCHRIKQRYYDHTA